MPRLNSFERNNIQDLPNVSQGLVPVLKPVLQDTRNSLEFDEPIGQTMRSTRIGWRYDPLVEIINPNWIDHPK